MMLAKIAICLNVQMGKCFIVIRCIIDAFFMAILHMN